MDDLISDFVQNYPTGDKAVSISVEDSNAEFRGEIMAFVVVHPDLASQDLISDLVRHESNYSRSSEARVGILLELISLYIERFPYDAVSMIFATGNSMDVDGRLQSGGLILTENARDSAIQNILKVVGDRPGGEILLRSLRKATLIK